MDKENMTIPYIAYESALDRAERRDKLHISIIALLITLLVLSNIAWIIVWNQYDYVDNYSITASQDGEGLNMLSGGDLTYGANGNNQAEEIAGS